MQAKPEKPEPCPGFDWTWDLDVALPELGGKAAGPAKRPVSEPQAKAGEAPLPDMDFDLELDVQLPDLDAAIPPGAGMEKAEEAVSERDFDLGPDLEATPPSKKAEKPATWTWTWTSGPSRSRPPKSARGQGQSRRRRV